ncbi:MAG TPA: hypothetical protein VGF20_09420 [Candidatus Acidoferrum sp.]|jgi:hypothetical protein
MMTQTPAGVIWSKTRTEGQLFSTAIREGAVSVAWYIVLEHKISGLDHFVNGKALAKAVEKLDSLAKDRGVLPLMGFFSAPQEEIAEFAKEHGISSKQGSAKNWFRAEDGIMTVRALINEGEKGMLDVNVVAELREFYRVLEAARHNSVRWHLAVDF